MLVKLAFIVLSIVAVFTKYGTRVNGIFFFNDHRFISNLRRISTTLKLFAESSFNDPEFFVMTTFEYIGLQWIIREEGREFDAL